MFSSKKDTEKVNSGQKINILFSIVCGCFFIMLLLLARGLTDDLFVYACIACAVAFAVCECVGMRIISQILKKKNINLPDAANPFLIDIILCFISKLFIPVVISNDEGKIIWFNGALTKRFPLLSSVYGASVESIFSVKLTKTLAPDNEEGVPFSYLNFSLMMKSYNISSNGKSYYISVISDKTDVANALSELKMSKLIVSYVMIDNIDEIMQYINDNSRNACAEIDSILKEWAESLDAVIKEYERDKYILLFEYNRLKEMVDEKFGILDRIREIRVGESIIPVTISMGIADIDASIIEKSKAARLALDTALQRGGDQVVLKTEDSVEYYGGRTKSVQKRTKVRARVVTNELIAQISKSTNVIIMGHKFADFDSFGACVGLARLCMFCGAKVNIVVNADDRNLSLPLKKMTELSEYSHIFISSFDGQDLLTTDTLVIVVDVNNPNLFEAPEIVSNAANVIFIDHHIKHPDFNTNAQLAYIEPSASSACEIISEFLEQALPQGLLLPTEANLLFTGIALDTKQFSRNCGIRTFGAAQYLRSEGANPQEVQEYFVSELDEFVSQARFESNVTVYKKVIAISAISENTNQNGRITAAKVADKLLSLKGVKASFSICKVDDVIYISARSSGEINVQKLLESCGGGGHFDVAGAQLKGVTLNDALVILKNSIDKYFADISDTQKNQKNTERT